MKVEQGARSAAVETIGAWTNLRPAQLWLSAHGYESRCTSHLEMPTVPAERRISVGFEFPDDDESVVGVRVAQARQRLTERSFQLLTLSDDDFDGFVRSEVEILSGDPVARIIVDISSMNRGRIASLILACSARAREHPVELQVVYFPSSFVSHKHEYEPLEFFGPVHERVAGWPVEPDFPMAIVIGLGTEPRRADGVAETLEPDIVSLFVPRGDELEYLEEIFKENRRVLEVGGEPILYPVRDPAVSYSILRANVERLSDRARVIVVPLGPKIFSALATNVALDLGPQVGVWKASAGRGVEPVDVVGTTPPVLAKFMFGGDDGQGSSLSVA